MDLPREELLPKDFLPYEQQLITQILESSYQANKSLTWTNIQLSRTIRRQFRKKLFCKSTQRKMQRADRKIKRALKIVIADLKASLKQIKRRALTSVLADALPDHIISGNFFFEGFSQGVPLR